MFSIKLVTALVGVALAIAAPAAYAMPVDPVGAPGTTQQVPDVPPPPSSIATSAADEYEKLRAPDAPVGGTAVADEPSSPSGFDWVSAAIGAIAAAGIALATVAALSTRRRTALG
jgi:hypothetical protein